MNVTKDKIHIVIVEGEHIDYFEPLTNFEMDQAIAEFHVPVSHYSPLELIAHAVACIIQEHRPVTMIVSCRNCFQGAVFGAHTFGVDSASRVYAEIMNLLEIVQKEAGLG